MLLSVDFDYFVDNSKDYLNDVLTYGWDRVYELYPEVLNIGIINVDVLIKIKYLLNKLNSKSILIAESHKDCLNFFEDYLKDNESYEDVVNMDFHHDCYADVGVTECNWFGKLSESYNNRFMWVGRKDSDLACNYYAVDRYLKLPIGRVSRLFICKSPLYTPKHLHHVFSDIFYN